MDLFNMLLDLIGLAIVLVSKFWVFILFLLGYLLFGGGRRSRPSSAPRRNVLTPVSGGGIPRLGRTAVPMAEGESSWQHNTPISRLPEPKSPVEPADSPMSYALDGEAASFAPTTIGDASDFLPDVKTTPDAPANKPNTDYDGRWNAREGMKWALIFSPPRAKDPFTPPHRRRMP